MSTVRFLVSPCKRHTHAHAHAEGCCTELPAPALLCTHLRSNLLRRRGSPSSTSPSSPSSSPLPILRVPLTTVILIIRAEITTSPASACAPPSPLGLRLQLRRACEWYSAILTILGTDHAVIRRRHIGPGIRGVEDACLRRGGRHIGPARANTKALHHPLQAHHLTASGRHRCTPCRGTPEYLRPGRDNRWVRGGCRVAGDRDNGWVHVQGQGRHRHYCRVHGHTASHGSNGRVCREGTEVGERGRGMRDVVWLLSGMLRHVLRRLSLQNLHRLPGALVLLVLCLCGLLVRWP